jgi:8-oxo-dGTP pyrophosphatase MutT (NUDIX family)
MKRVRSCGFLIYRGRPVREFLLMRHPTRWDLPKGHVDPGETDYQCALRELREETGIPEDAIDTDPEFRFTHRYQVRAPGAPGGKALKTLVIFLAELLRDVPIETAEHGSFSWLPWRPPHRIQEQTVDPLLSAVDRHWRKSPRSATAPSAAAEAPSH